MMMESVRGASDRRARAAHAGTMSAIKNTISSLPKATIRSAAAARCHLYDFHMATSQPARYYFTVVDDTAILILFFSLILRLFFAAYYVFITLMLPLICRRRRCCRCC